MRRDSRRRGLARRFPPPQVRFDARYFRRRDAFVAAMLDDPAILELFAVGAPLPSGYGLGLDERAVEYPWLFAQRLSGMVLDAGSTLNHLPILDRLQPRLRDLHVVTFAYEGLAFPDRGISYLYADLRDLPYRDSIFDVVASISTLEHVGMDNNSYAPGSGRADDPPGARARAVEELRRVTANDGLVYVTVPYGRSHDLGWLQQFDRPQLQILADALGPATTTSVYEYGDDGWQISDLERARDAMFGGDVPAARAVACLTTRV